MLEPQIHMALDRLSNDEFARLRVDPTWIDEAAAAFKDALQRQLIDRGKNGFRLRMSNVGRPLCQLQMAANGATASRKPYNLKMMMMIGDAVESITDVILKIAGANITGGKDQVELELGGTVINGTDDVEIDNRVFDIKSCSPCAFNHKWSKGYEHLRANDDFGYVGQLIGYAKTRGKDPGGWIAVCKSTGQVKVTLADVSAKERAQVKSKIKANVKAVNTNAPFKRCFEPVLDTWRGKETGAKSCARLASFVAT